MVDVMKGALTWLRRLARMCTEARVLVAPACDTATRPGAYSLQMQRAEAGWLVGGRVPAEEPAGLALCCGPGVSGAVVGACCGHDHMGTIQSPDLPGTLGHVSYRLSVRVDA